MNNIPPMNKIICGDAIEQLKTFPDNFFDSIVTDPPAGISFMGKEWDDDKGGRDNWIKWLSEVFIAAKRTLKPGGHALVWALPRTSHWTGMALEDAGFEVRDIVHHIFGTGFPKSLDISKQIDKQVGMKRDVVGSRTRVYGYKKDYNNSFENAMFDVGMDNKITTPASPEANQWSGWGSALKPAVECWWLVRKPISERTIAQNVLKWGTGGINIDGCRVPFQSSEDYKNLVNNYNGGIERATYSKETWKLHGGGWKLGEGIQIPDETKGRFPANLIHDGSDEVLAEFAKAGISKSIVAPRGGTSPNPMSWGNKRKDGDKIAGHNDFGTPARFFYCAKPSKAERDAGCEELRNSHPTVKAQALMQYFIKLITPPGGIVLDMFAGSGSTLIAAKMLGHPYVGIEIDPDYCKIAEQRLIAELNGNRSLDAYNEYESK